MSFLYFMTYIFTHIIAYYILWWSQFSSVKRPSDWKAIHLKHRLGCESNTKWRKIQLIHLFYIESSPKCYKRCTHYASKITITIFKHVRGQLQECKTNLPTCNYDHIM